MKSAHKGSFSLHFDADPDPATHFDADEDPAYQVDADPTFQFYADPDPQHFFHQFVEDTEQHKGLFSVTQCCDPE